MHIVFGSTTEFVCFSPVNLLLQKVLSQEPRRVEAK